MRPYDTITWQRTHRLSYNIPVVYLAHSCYDEGTRKEEAHMETEPQSAEAKLHALLVRGYQNLTKVFARRAPHCQNVRTVLRAAMERCGNSHETSEGAASVSPPRRGIEGKTFQLGFQDDSRS